MRRELFDGFSLFFICIVTVDHLPEKEGLPLEDVANPDLRDRDEVMLYLRDVQVDDKSESCKQPTFEDGKEVKMTATARFEVLQRYQS